MNTKFTMIRKYGAETAKWLFAHRIITSLLIVGTVFGVEFLLLDIPQANASYTIANSARFNSTNSAYLSLTMGTGNRNKWTVSMWVKRAALEAVTPLWSTNDPSGDAIWLSGGTSGIIVTINGNIRLQSTALFRDPSAWFHIVVVHDVANPHLSERLRVYVNGIEYSEWSTDARNLLTANIAKTSTAVTHSIGRHANGTSYADVYIADVYFIDDAALAPTCFGETDGYGHWR